MNIYPLYLESGPRKKKTMVHVLDLLGCVANGPTTEAALANTPAVIRLYLRFLQRHGEAVNADEKFETTVAEHVTEGYFMGEGSPAVMFKSDHDLLTAEEGEIYIRRLEWMRGDTIKLVKGLTDEQIGAKPGTGRSIREIMQHIVGSSQYYMHAMFGKTPKLDMAVKAVRKEEGDLLDWAEIAGTAASERLRAMTPEERAKVVVTGQTTWTARKMLRQAMEHEWNHLMEISARLEN
jgi:predicted RNase H-like HicB family nuclease/uncharacterized damage-inducible protein DinB